MADKTREFIYVEPKDYIPKDIYDKYFKNDEEEEQADEKSEENDQGGR